MRCFFFDKNVIRHVRNLSVTKYQMSELFAHFRQPWFHMFTKFVFQVFPRFIELLFQVFHKFMNGMHKTNIFFSTLFCPMIYFHSIFSLKMVISYGIFDFEITTPISRNRNTVITISIFSISVHH
jgi:hypothetical protein